MARYGANGAATNTAAKTVLEIANGGSPRRLYLEEVMLGAKGTPADQAAKYQWKRLTGLNGPSTTSITPVALDQADQAATVAAWLAPDVEPTYASELPVFEIGLQLRSPLRWVPISRRSRPTVPATTGGGWGAFTSAVTTTWSAVASIVWEE